MAARPDILRISESWGLARGWSLCAQDNQGREKIIASGRREDLVRRAQTLAEEKRTVILVVSASLEILEAYESIDCRQVIEDGVEVIPAMIIHGRVRHVVQPIQPDSIQFR